MYMTRSIYYLYYITVRKAVNLNVEIVIQSFSTMILEPE